MDPTRRLSLAGLRAATLVPVALVISCLLLRVADPLPLSALRLATFDGWQRAAPRQADPSFPVKVIAIDEASLQRFGQWPWGRHIVSDLVTRLHHAGARSIAIDLVFAEADRLGGSSTDLMHAAGDVRLATAIGNSRTVLALVGEERGTRSVPAPKAALAATGIPPLSSIRSFPAAVLPIPALTESAPALGAVNWFPERDQIVRRVPVLVGIASHVYPSLSLEALRLGLGETTILVSSSQSRQSATPAPAIEAVRVGGLALSVDPDGEMWMRFAATDPRRTISAADILDGHFAREAIEGRYVVIGATAIGLSDVRATPLAPDVPGVEIHAQALEQILAGVSISRPAWMIGFELALIALLGVAVAVALRSVTAVPAALASALLVAAVIAGSWVVYNRLGLLADPTYPVLATVMVYVGALLTSYLATERERNRIRMAFGHYLSPVMVEQLARDPTRLKLGGETRNLTVLFVDVRNFTTLSESMSASELVAFTNRLFAPLSKAVLMHKGTIDKYMGDAILAFWNAPLDDPCHPQNACRAALQMCAAVERMHHNGWTGPGQATRIGIGINTGDAVVGNVGSPQRFDYSVIGEVVNTASRLQDATKKWGADILVGEATAAAVSEFAIIEIGEILLRGKARSERLFALLGNETTKASPEFQLLTARHSQFLLAIRMGDRTTIGEALAGCMACAFPGTDRLYRSFEQEWRPTPPST